MKKVLSFLLLLFISQPVGAFNDIEHNWYKDSIQELKDLWIVNGFDDGSFLPHDSITRAEVLKIILQTSDIDVTDPEESCFTDVRITDWQAKYICSWVEKWITKWYEDGTFRQSGEVTVLETLAFTLRAFDIDVRDSKNWEEWFERYQEFADENNIIPIHSYSTSRVISRWQAAQIIERMRSYVGWKKLDYASQWCSINPSLKSGSYNMQISGLNRNYLLYVPSTVAKWKELSLVVAFHGRTNNNEQVRDYMQLWWGSYGYKQNDFIVAYPAGIWPWPFSWSQYENIEFFDAIVTEISEKLCINRDEVFSVGHSLGSYMSNKVSCQRGDVIRAMAGVASDGFRGECSGPVASLITHLEGDPLASYSWGQRAYRIRSEVNMCQPEEKSTNLGDIRNCVQKTSCSSGNTTLFCNNYDTYGNDQHSWPKNGSDDILDFFRQIN
jgi:polyhydroxybutyrate depolymerase